jgi:Domain of unknown function (DUF4169)
MGDVIKLRIVRKQAKRKLGQQQAAANRLHYGRSKSDRLLDQTADAKARRALDQHRIETGEKR